MVLRRQSMSKNKIYIFILFLGMIYSCSSSWSKAINKGSIPDQTFHQSIPIEIKTGLLIVPVIIQGREYKFIFDSGAPTSISKEIQEKFKFKRASKSHIVDTEGNKKRVNYVSVDTLRLGDIALLDQTAFVGDFSSNPVIECMKVDGILGSNTMRLCNWTIDSFKKEILLFNSEILMSDDTYSAPFTTDRQYDMLVDLTISNSKVRNIKIDYGSNGSLSLPKSGFTKLKDGGILTNTYSVIGQSQTGLIGEVKNIEYEISYIDTLFLGDCLFENVRLKGKGSGLLGNRLLRDYIVSIDWTKQMLFFEKNRPVIRSNASFGIGLGYNKAGRFVYVQSVTTGSSAYEKGLRPLLKVAKVDSLDFTSENNYCDYVDYINYNPDSMLLTLEDGRFYKLKKEVLDQLKNSE